jgi:hypothetical protein
MPNTPRTMERSIPLPSSLMAGKTARPSPIRRCSRITLGFWLGGIILGTAGSILGAYLPYHHPVARLMSVLWWGIYLGCLGGSLGALLGLFRERTAVCPVGGLDDAGKTPTEE